jgi:hypothetical protein
MVWASPAGNRRISVFPGFFFGKTGGFSFKKYGKPLYVGEFPAAHQPRSVGRPHFHEKT